MRNDRIHLHRAGDRLAIRAGDRLLAEYVYRPSDASLESPRPYFSPLNTLGGELVSVFRPHDHVWHKGISWSLPVVGDENFWGGPTFVRGKGYVQLQNNGMQRHRGFRGDDGDASDARIVEELDWVSETGEAIFDETRCISAALLDDTAWVLGFESRMRNVTRRVIPIGSPTTRGRDNAGYGGLFWRGPRSFTGGTVLAPGIAGGDELRGTRAPWMGFTGRHDGSGAASTIVMADDPGNAQHPPQWFARAEDYAALCPAPFFSVEHEVWSGEELVERVAVVVADGASDPSRAAALAEKGLRFLAVGSPTQTMTAEPGLRLRGQDDHD